MKNPVRIKEIHMDEKVFRDTRTQIGILKSRGVI